LGADAFKVTRTGVEKASSARVSMMSAFSFNFSPPFFVGAQSEAYAIAAEFSGFRLQHISYL
jgi:hypothetical protein